MKKLIALILTMVCVFGLVGCDNSNQQEQEEYEANKDVNIIQVTGNSVGELGSGALNQLVKISDEDGTTLSQIVNGSTWKEEPTDCVSDCLLVLNGDFLYYNSENGILNTHNKSGATIHFNNGSNESEKSLVLSEEDRATVNAILEKYITLGFETN